MKARIKYSNLFSLKHIQDEAEKVEYNIISERKMTDKSEGWSEKLLKGKPYQQPLFKKRYTMNRKKGNYMVIY